MLPKMLRKILRGFTTLEFEEEAKLFFEEHPFPEGEKDLLEGMDAVFYKGSNFCTKFDPLNNSFKSTSFISV